MKKFAILPLIAALLGIGTLSYGMATEQVGPDPADRPTHPQPGWPKGIEMPLRHPSRVYSIWVNGNENFYFKATPDDISELLDLFSKARLRDHQVKIEFGQKNVDSFQKKAFEYNVKLEVLSGIALFMMNRDNDEQTLEPNLTIYLDADGALLGQIKWPQNVIVTSTAELPELKANRTLPKRKAMYGRVQLEGEDPAAAMVRGVQTRVIFWDKDVADGIEVASVDREGTFKVVLSDQEIAAMQKGDAWLTTTTGNWSRVIKNDDPKFPLAMLSPEKEKAQAQKIAGVKYYYGRILFQDGSPPVIDPKPWSGAEISVNFPYAGKAEPDAEGYFQVYFDPDQLEQLLKRRPSKNIYIPNRENGSSTAREIFPPELLSQDKAKAGVVKIAKPDYEAGK